MASARRRRWRPDLLEGMGYQVRHTSGIPVPLGEELADAAAVLVTVQEITDAMLAAMPACKIVARVGTGLDSIDLDAAARRGVLVTNVADYSVDEVSTHAIALLLASARRLPQYLDLVRPANGTRSAAGPSAGSGPDARPGRVRPDRPGDRGQGARPRAPGAGLRPVPARGGHRGGRGGARSTGPPCWASRTICPCTSRSRRSPST